MRHPQDVSPVMALVRAALAACAAVGWLSGGAVPRAQAATPRIEHRLLFLGDNGPHQPPQRAAVLIPALRQRGIELVYVDNPEVLASESLSEFDGLVVYANIDQITPEQEAGLLRFVESGKGFVPLHCASFCFRNSDKYIELVGAQFQRHGGEVFSTRIAPESREIFEGFAGFSSWDETYIHHRHNERERIVLEYREQGEQAEGQEREPWTWIRTQGRGRIFYTAWGHDLRTWSHPGFHNLVERGIRWACQDDPRKAGPFVDVSRFDPPTAVAGAGRMEDLQYDDVGDEIPHYNPRTAEGQGRNMMQRPLAPADSMEYFTLLEGFALDLYAAEPDLGPKPIAMNWDHRGRLWVCESIDYPNDAQPPGTGNDRIRICEDTDGDGRADRFTVFAEELSIPTAIAFHRGGAIVQNGEETLYLKDVDGDDRADVRKTLLRGWGLGDTHGGVSNFRYGHDNWFWAMQGYNGSRPRNDQREFARFSQGFFRFRLDDQDPPNVVDLEFLRSTNNNTWGLGLSEEGLVFGSTANGNPSVFMPIPNRYYERVRGWSADVLGTIADSSRFSPVTDRVRQVDHFGSYTAGAGHALYTARTYPAQWWNKTAFVCGPTGHLVGAFVLRREGAGFRSASPCNLAASRDEWTAPIMAEVGPDGNVWVLDWYNYIVQHNPTPQGFRTGKGAAYETELRDKRFGRIYRVKHEAGDEAAWPDLAAADPAQLVAALRHPNMFWRLHAQRLLVERGQRDVVPQLLDLLADVQVDALGLNVGAIHALGVLRGLDAAADDPAVAEAICQALTHPAAGVRRNAIQALPPDDASRDALLASGVLRDADAQVQLAAILAVADLPPAPTAAVAAAELLLAQGAADPVLADALASALAAHEADGLAALADLAAEQEAALREPRLARVLQVLGEHLGRGKLAPAQREQTLAALTRTPASFALPVLRALARTAADAPGAEATPAMVASLQQLLLSLPNEARADVVRLAEAWRVGDSGAWQRDLANALGTALAKTDAEDQERVAAARSLIELDPRSAAAAELVLDQITPQASPELVAGLLSALAASDADELGAQLAELSAELLPQAREQAIDVLLRRPATTEALLAALADQVLIPANLRLDQVATLREHPDAAVRQRAAEVLAASGGLPDADRQRLIEQWIEVTQTSGDAANGKQLFAKHCTVCHAHSGVGASIGPDLTGMFVHPKLELLTHVLDPNRSVEGNYRSYSVVASGLVFNGLFAGESRTVVTLIDANGKSHRIQRDEIDEIIPSNRSLMPEGFEKVLSRQELADLLEFLSTRQRYVPLPLERAATAVTTRPLFGGGPDGPDRMVFAEWTPKTFRDVLFRLVDPQEGAVRNAVMLRSNRTPWLRRMPSEVKLPCGYPARAIHLLSGVSGWGYPAHQEKSVSLVVRLHYENGATEEHELTNGLHFADYIRRVDVPGSEFAFDLQGQQLRYLVLEPRDTQKIVEIEFVKTPDPTVPIVMAVTVELPE